MPINITTLNQTSTGKKQMMLIDMILTLQDNQKLNHSIA